MQVKTTGTRFEFFLEGPISEKTGIYDYNIKNATEVVVDMEKVTFINSIGVKNWILWTNKVPTGCKIELTKCPFVIINQITMVHGFLPKSARVQSFFAPYICDCGAEANMLFRRGTEFEYAQNGEKEKFAAPEVPCKKCSSKMEPDFIDKKIVGFLNPA
ncbi:hypothetical protein [Bdellovibrio bacteriovorus]|uniref:hypothetical protein n=1 Tax=Bdellovibrio TaxID=958 RepID=UPI0035A9460D